MASAEEQPGVNPAGVCVRAGAAVGSQEGPRVGAGAHGRLREVGEVSALQGKRLRGTATCREGCTLTPVQTPKLDSARAFASFSSDE